MRLIKGMIQKVLAYYSNMMLMKKYLLSFCLLVAIPTIIFSVNYFININETLNNEYQNNKEKVIHSSMNTVIDSIRGLQSINKYFQTSTVLSNYLQGKYEKDADVIHYYNNDINNLFSYIDLTNDLVVDMAIYSYSEEILLIPPYLLPIDTFAYGEYTKEITPQKGVWVMDNEGDVPALYYFMKFYSANYHQELGILSIQVDIEKLLSAIDRDIYDYMRLVTPDVTLNYDGYSLTAIGVAGEGIPVNDRGHRKLVLKYALPPHLGDIYLVSQIDINTQYYKWELIKAVLYIVFLSVILGAFYFITYHTIVKRLKIFKKHISSMENERIVPFEEVHPMDEVGFLMLSFNQMADRINNLINRVYREEILKKEAMYYALEAQINPHFLYNTLESIRMVAEENCDFDVSDQLYLLGSILRYTLANNQDSTSIAEEISYTEKYLTLFKNRNKDNFIYEIHNHIEDPHVIIPKYIVQPLIENAIKHGFAKKLDTWQVLINVDESKEYTCITVSDNGKGMEQDAIDKLNTMLRDTAPGEVLHYDSGIGLFNVNDRIKFYGGDDTGLSVWQNDLGGLSVRAKIKKKLRASP